MEALSRGWHGFGRPAAGVVLKLWAGQRLDLALAITVQMRAAGWRSLLAHLRRKSLPAPVDGAACSLIWLLYNRTC